MRRLIVPILGLLLLAAAACDGGSSGSSGPDLGDDTDVGLPVETVPACPFTAAQISTKVAEVMNVEEGTTCTFRAANSVALLTIMPSVKSAGEATWDFQRKMAESTYATIVDIEEGDRGYLAVGDIGGEVVVISDAGSFTVTMSGFQLDPAGYERMLRQLLAEIPK